MRSLRLAVAGLLVLGAAACANAMTFSAPRSKPIVRITERQDKGTVTLRRGQQLRVVLHSTYWQFQKAPNPSVLRLERAPKVRPRLSGCVPGEGCGTVTATYLAAARGSSTVRAARSSCGEAMGCTGDNGRYTVRIVVR
jgi:hypothetical protein